MKKYIKPIILLVVLIVIAITVHFMTAEKVQFNEGYVNGNTAGNLYNTGMMCEYDGTLYFANPNDNYKLYSMDIDGKNLKKLNNDVPNYINVDDNYIYYVRNNIGDNIDYEFFAFFQNALCRIPRDGGNTKILDTDPCNYATLIGNYIYYLHYDTDEASTLYKVKIDGTERKQVRKEAIFTCSTEGQYFYYNGVNTSGSVYQFDSANDSSSSIYEGNCYKPTVGKNGTSIFYIDGDKNNCLMHVDTTTDSVSIVTSDSIDAYNVYGDYIYYQKYDNEASGLCVIKSDGSGYQMIQEGTFKNIYVTSSYVFFTEYSSGDTYYIYKNNPYDVMEFNPGVAK